MMQKIFAVTEKGKNDMARYIDADSLYRRVKTHTNPYGKPTLDYKSGVKVLEMINQEPTADVVPKSEVERLTINMNAYGLTAKRLAEENESLEIELENMRRNLGDAREGWNDAECEVERLTVELEAMRGAANSYKMHYENLAREIFEEIEKWLVNEYVPYIRGYSNSLSRNLAELKKKYTEEKT